MKTYNADVNTGRAMANNGCDFFEDTNEHSGVWCGFQPHKDGCIIAAVTIEDADGTEASTPTWVLTTANLDSYISAGLVGVKQGYITSITLSSGAVTMLRDNLRNQ